MIAARYPDAIDTRLVFRVYAVVAGLGVLSALVMAIVVTRSQGPSIPLGATLGLVGGLSLVLAGQAAAFSTIEDPLARVRGLKQFAVTHLLAGALLWLLPRLLLSAPTAADRPFPEFGAIVPYWLLAPNLFITAAVLLYLAVTAIPGPRFTATVRSAPRAAEGPERTSALREKEGPASMRRLRSQYEEQIRQAARQEERARLARDLHDAVKQQLFVIQTAAATVQARVDTDLAGVKEATDQVRTAVREALTEMEAMLTQLQAAPLEDVGLVEALKKQCEALGFRTGAEVTIDTEPLPPNQMLPPGAHDTVFRVAQEALANIGRHARAQHVTVRLAPRNRALMLDVIDDGVGFDPIGTRRGMGIGNMQMRAAEIGGHFALASSPGAGTTVSLSVPFVARSAGSYLRRAGGFGAAVVVCSVLLAGGWGGLRPIWIGGFWIALIGTARYLVAARRVYRSGAVWA